MPEYVTLEYPVYPTEPDEVRERPVPPHVCDTPAHAMQALDELGVCMNWATVTEVGSMTFVMYQAWVYRQTPERFVQLPFSPDAEDFAQKFSALVMDIFAPFRKDSDIHRSFITVTPHSSEKNCFFLNLVLCLDAKATEEIRAALKSVEDGHEDIPATVYWLD